MPTSAFGGAVSLGAFTNAWVESASIPLVVGRIADNGNGPIFITQLQGLASGNGASRNVTLTLGATSTAAFPRGANATALSTGLVNCSGLAVANGGSATFRISADGSFVFGRGSGANNTTDNNGTSYSGTLGGSYAYIESPTAPQTPSASPTGAGQATVTWAAPADDGGSVVTGYLVEYGTSPTLTGASTTTVGAVTSTNITGLTPGATYYFRIRAQNFVTNGAGCNSVPSAITTGIVMGTVAGAPTALVATAVAGAVGLTWSAPASDGGSAITSYTLDYATDAGFTTGLVSLTGLPPTPREKTVVGLTPGATYYYRVKAVNALGASAASTTASVANPARSTIDIVQGAAVTAPGGTQVEVRSDGADTPTLTLGYVAFGTGSTFATIATVSVGVTSSDFAAPGGPRNLELVTDPAGNLFLIGRRGDDASTVLIKRYARTGTTDAWTLAGTSSQALASTGDPLVAFASVYVAGTTPTLLVIARRAGTVSTGALSFAVVDPAVVAASGSTPFLSSGSDPSWLSTPPAGATLNSGVVDVAVMGGAASNRLAILANGFAVIDLVNGVIAGVSKSAGGTAITGPWARIVGVSASAFAVFVVSAGALSWTFYNSAGSVLGSGSKTGSDAFGGAFGRQWGVYLDSVAQLVTVYYVADNAGARQLESVDVSPLTYAASSNVVLTAALGAASSTNGELRIPEGAVDERRVLVTAANLLTGTKSTAAYSDRSGNVMPLAPTTADVTGFDATAAFVLTWAFGDSNPADTQTAYELEVQRVSDSVVIVATGKVASAVASRTLAANALVNGVNYRWRVRTWDVLDTMGTYSAYDTFTTAATGTLTITTPSADNPAGLDVSSLNIVWSYVQANGYTQTQRRVQVIRVSDSAVLSDTTMQASVVGNYTVTGLPDGVPVRIEVSIVTTAPGTPTIGPATRLLTTNYGSPMTPIAVLTAGVDYIAVAITNPAPTGSRPATASNAVQRRLTGSGAAFVTIARVAPNATYNDHAVASKVQYDYRVKASS